MKELLIISGKGGTGKTSVVGAFAALSDSKVLVDCDVDAADLHLILQPRICNTREFYGSQKAVVGKTRCVGCGLCIDVCRFGAISWGEPAVEIDSVSCEGCGVCSHACPQKAIVMKDNLSGHWFVSETPYGPLVHARLGIAEENSGKLVAEVRRQARSIAENRGLDYIITDGPPGIGCPVISSISGVDLALVVTEPTAAGSHDLKRVLELTRHFGVEAMVCINKWDLNETGALELEEYCSREGVEVAGRIPFDEGVVQALVNGQPAVSRNQSDGEKGKAASALEEVWRRVLSRLQEGA